MSADAVLGLRVTVRVRVRVRFRVRVNPHPHPSQVLAAVASGDPVSARSPCVAECAARIIAAHTGAGASAG